MNSNQLSASLHWCKYSASIPTVLQLHKASTLLGPPWAHWKRRGWCERAAFNATSSAQTGRFSQNHWHHFPIFRNLPSFLWRGTVSPSFHWIYWHHSECQDLTLNTKCSADVVTKRSTAGCSWKSHTSVLLCRPCCLWSDVTVTQRHQNIKPQFSLA